MDEPQRGSGICGKEISPSSVYKCIYINDNYYKITSCTSVSLLSYSGYYEMLMDKNALNLPTKRIYVLYYYQYPMPMGARSKAWVCAAVLLGMRVRILLGHRCLSLVIVVCCQVEVPASG